MFYATKIVSVGNGYVVDARGNTLYFAGYLPVKVGDTVFTDGNIVFGNSKPKGSVITANEPSGIPVISDYLRGYFKLDGSFKQFNIKGDNWLVNDKKIYAHDGDDTNIIDAEIATDGLLFSALLEQDIDSCLISIFKNATLVEQINIYSLLANFINETLDAVNIDLEGLDFVSDDTSIHPSVSNFKLSPDGSWSLLLSANISATRTWHYVNTRWSFTFAKEHIRKFHVFDSLPTPSEFFAMAYELIGDIGIDLDLESKMQVPSSAWRQLGLDINLDKYTPIFSWNESTLQTGSLTANSRWLLKFSSSGHVDKIAEKKWYEPTWIQQYSSSNLFTTSSTQSIPNPPSDSSKPYEEIIAVTPGYSSSPFVTGSVKAVNVTGYVDGIPIAVDSGQEASFSQTEQSYYYLTSRRYRLASGEKLLPIHQDFDDIDNKLRFFTFPIQDGFEALLENFNDNIDSWRLAQIYAPDNNTVSYAFRYFTHAHKWNMAIAPLNNNQFIFAAHNNGLYLINPDRSFSLIDSGVKNFRLRTLKKIRKAKH